ncbi:hypothetical protein CABS01_00572 [Colletotrichum abscissum]|uniref:uncharacterized protein n=1 Tax=Colletotrichum abscissum TaxID=1671311 RepID=UPI0027D6A7B9|nr:uncharacterized protein CABS01_00572 [Colletotrichum abscissum]KAK1525483.1 hypothetical protein CABS01_00572 [Colletotrichum abscissum]
MRAVQIMTPSPLVPIRSVNVEVSSEPRQTESLVTNAGHRISVLASRVSCLPSSQKMVRSRGGGASCLFGASPHLSSLTLETTHALLSPLSSHLE